MNLGMHWVAGGPAPPGAGLRMVSVMRWNRWTYPCQGLTCSVFFWFGTISCNPSALRVPFVPDAILSLLHLAPHHQLYKSGTACTPSTRSMASSETWSGRSDSVKLATKGTYSFANCVQSVPHSLAAQVMRSCTAVSHNSSVVPCAVS